MRFHRLYLLGFFLLATVGCLYGQGGATGSILGTVTDSSGAIVQNAKIVVTNADTGLTYVTTSNTAGDYNAPSLNPGNYSLSVQQTGFQKTQTNTFVLAVDQKVRVDVSLKPGSINEQSMVTAQAVTLDTDTSALSQLVSERQVEDLPLNGRNFMQLLLIGAGAVTVGGEQGTMRQGQGNAVSINGGRPEGNNYTLDGLINTDQALVTPAVILSQDAIQEFKVESGTYSAEYGFSASQINIISKSGGNKLHGTVFEFDRNDAFDAKPFPNATNYNSSPPVPTSNAVLRQNQFGFVANGPVYIPKLYNGRDKTFWMANYEGWRIKSGQTVQSSVPNSAALTGNFAGETYAPHASVKGVSLPGGPLPQYGTPECAALLSLGQNCMPVNPLTGQPFPGNTIPTAQITSRLGQVVQNYNYFLAPTVPNQAEGITNFFQNIGLPLTTNQQTYRGDQTLRRFGSVFGRFTYSSYQNSSLNTASLNYGVETLYEKQKSWEVSHTISLGQASVNNFRFGHLDATAPQGAPAPSAAAIAALGESGTFTHYSALQQTWPNVSLSQYSGVGGPGNAYTGSDNPSWEYADSFTTIHGRHTLGFGADYRRWQLIRNLDDDFYGDWNFNAATILTNSVVNPKTGITSCPNAPVTVTGQTQAQSLCGTGNAIADLLLGYYGNAAGYSPGPLSPSNTAGNPQTHIFSYFAPYAEDDIKVTPKLTVNVGLRWDYRPAAYEKQNHFFWLDTTNANGGLCYADKTLSTDGVAPGGDATSGAILRYCGKVPHAGSKKPFAPRLGFAYRLPDDKTVLRGGYGIFFDSAEGREIDDSGDIYPYSIRNSLNPTGDPKLSKFSNDLFPSYTTLGPLPASTLSFIAVIESENPLNPYIQSRTLSIEHELAHNTTIEANYIGTKGTHLLDRRNIAQPYGISSADLPFCQADPTDTTHKCPRSSRLPYTNFTNYYIDSDWHGYSNYNALNLKFEHRAADLAVTGVFTWAKSMDDKSAAAGVGATGSGYQGFQDNHNPRGDYGPSDFDVDHRFVASYIYDLPVGRGKKFLGQANRLEDLAVGGWEITGITTLQTGFPFSVSATDQAGLLHTDFQRANIASGCNLHGNLTKTLQRFNTDCFTQPAIGVYGNSRRNTFRQPGINNWDMGLAKGFHITESSRFLFRLDTFNTFNHHQYAVSVGGLATGGSGGGSAIDNGFGDSTFGQITSSSPARILQLSGKLTF